MRRIVSLALTLLFLSGCSGENREMNRVLSFRQKLLQAQECSFQGQIWADYGESLYEFTLEYRSDNQGDLAFSVTEPETIAGIQGRLSEDGGEVIFEDTALQFPLLASGRLSPVSAGWVVLKALRGGNIQGICMEDDLLRLSVDDSFEENALRLDVWMDDEDIPVAADILWEGRRILSMKLCNFALL